LKVGEEEFGAGIRTSDAQAGADAVLGACHQFRSGTGNW
jgi:hypothetical protein